MWNLRARFALTGFLCIAGLAPASSANTYTVDDDGPADFSDIASAIAAAAPGDVLLVLPGSYAGFTLSKALTILGQGGVTITGPVVVIDVVAGEVAALADLSLLQGAGIVNCTRPIVLDGWNVLRTNYTSVFVDNCSDVRIAGSRLTGSSPSIPAGAGMNALTVRASRVEVSDCDLVGGNGQDKIDPSLAIGGPGGSAVDVLAGGDVHVYGSSLFGGDGGDGTTNVGVGGFGGDGGRGCYVRTGGSGLIAGSPAFVLAGGVPGAGSQQNGVPGFGLENHGALRYSGVTLDSSFFDPAGTVEHPDPPDPCLYARSDPLPGQPLSLRVETEPGATVELVLGRSAVVVPYAGMEEDELVVPLRVYHLGVVYASGVIAKQVSIPATLGPGYTFFAQARVTLPSGELRFTNSRPLVVR